MKTLKKIALFALAGLLVAGTLSSCSSGSSCQAQKTNNHLNSFRR